MDMLTHGGKSAREEIWYFAKPSLGAVRIGDFKYVFIDQPERCPGPKNKVNMPLIHNLRRVPFEPYSNTNWGVVSSDYMISFSGREFWRFAFVQKKVAGLARTAIDFPPMQKSASFNLEALKAQIQKAVQSHSGH